MTALDDALTRHAQALAGLSLQLQYESIAAQTWAACCLEHGPGSPRVEVARAVYEGFRARRAALAAELDAAGAALAEAMATSHREARA